MVLHVRLGSVQQACMTAMCRTARQERVVLAMEPCLYKLVQY